MPLRRQPVANAPLALSLSLAVLSCNSVFGFQEGMPYPPDAADDHDAGEDAIATNLEASSDRDDARRQEDGAVESGNADVLFDGSTEERSLSDESSIDSDVPDRSIVD